MRSPLPELLTASEVAEALRVSLATVTRWRKDGTLSGHKIGGVLRFRREDVETLITHGAPDPGRVA